MPALNLRYPFKNIDQSDDYLKIDVLNYIPPGINFDFSQSFAQNSSDTAGYGNSQILGSVILPIPEDISDTNTTDWQAGKMGPIATVAAGAALGIMGSENLFKGSINAVTDLFSAAKNASQTSVGQQAIQSGFAAKIAENITGNEVSGILPRLTGAVLNENTELLFNGVFLRPAFQFRFDMVPRSESESSQIKEIIRLFKSEMAAKKGLETGAAAGLFLKSPSVFRLKYMSGGQPHPYLNTFKICALTGTTVNYTASGTYATYSDATPVHMNMTLQFQELTPIYHEDYVDQGGGFKLTGTGY
jgi:hypothetical protein